MGVQREGGFSNYITMPLERIYDGKGLNPKLLAMVEPFCISYHGIKRADVQPGDKVLVVGAGTPEREIRRQHGDPDLSGFPAWR